MNIKDIVGGPECYYFLHNELVRVVEVTGNTVSYEFVRGFQAEDGIYKREGGDGFSPVEYRKLEDLVIIDKVPHRGRGWLIGQDGTIYTMRYEYIHGMVSAILFPELAAKHGYRPPDTKSTWRDYQRFELSHGDEIPLVRIALGMIMYGTNISKQDAPCTPAQIEGTRRVLIDHLGLKLSEEVDTNLSKVTVRKALKWLAEDER